jgi:hypothetical protein
VVGSEAARRRVVRIVNKYELYIVYTVIIELKYYLYLIEIISFCNNMSIVPYIYICKVF